MTTVTSDARSFDLGRRFPLILAPMQTVQLLGGPEGRAAFLAAARRAPASPAACSPARWPTRSRPSTPSTTCRPPPDQAEIDGVLYASHPIAVHDRGDRAAIERIRGRSRAAGHRAPRPPTSSSSTGSRPARCEAEAGAPRPARRGAAAHRRDRGVRRLAWWRCSVPESVLRVCALYPDLMNIYADRGNLLLLERRCAWRGIGFEVTAAGLGDEIDPRGARPLLPRRRPGPRPAALRAGPRRRQARRAARGGRRRARDPRRLRRLPAARALLRAGRRASCRASGSST